MKYEDETHFAANLADLIVLCFAVGMLAPGLFLIVE